MDAGREREWCLLIVDDDPGMIFLVERLLQRSLPVEEMPTVFTAATPAEAEGWLARLACHGLVVLSDYDLKATRTGLDVLALAEKACSASVRLLMSGTPRHELPTLAHHPIHDFIPKDAKPMEIVETLSMWLKKARTQG